MEAEAVSKSYTTNTRFVCNNDDIVAFRLLVLDYFADNCSYDVRVPKAIRSYCVALRIRFPPANRLEQSTNLKQVQVELVLVLWGWHEPDKWTTKRSERFNLMGLRYRRTNQETVDPVDGKFHERKR